MAGNKTKIRYSDDSDLKEENEEKEFEVPKIPVINFKSDGLTLLMYNIISLEKTTKWFDVEPHWRYGIEINKGISSSIRIPKTDIFVYYDTEEVRDKVYKDLLKTMEEFNYKVIEI